MTAQPIADLTPVWRSAILARLTDLGPATRRDLIAASGMPEHHAGPTLGGLIDDGLIERYGRGRYRLPMSEGVVLATAGGKQRTRGASIETIDERVRRREAEAGRAEEERMRFVHVGGRR